MIVICTYLKPLVISPKNPDRSTLTRFCRNSVILSLDTSRISTQEFTSTWWQFSPINEWWSLSKWLIKGQASDVRACSCSCSLHVFIHRSPLFFFFSFKIFRQLCVAASWEWMALLRGCWMSLTPCLWLAPTPCDEVALPPSLARTLALQEEEEQGRRMAILTTDTTQTQTDKTGRVKLQLQVQ